MKNTIEKIAKVSNEVDGRDKIFHIDIENHIASIRSVIVGEGELLSDNTFNLDNEVAIDEMNKDSFLKVYSEMLGQEISEMLTFKEPKRIIKVFQ